MESNNFSKNNKIIDYYIRVHYELFGSCFKWEDCFEDIYNRIEYEDKYSFYLYVEHRIKKYLQSKVKYGIFIGRCQPFSIAHSETIQEIIRDGIKPVIVLGSIDKNNDRNPLSFEERKALIKKVYPIGVKIIGLSDKDSWEDWLNSIITKLKEEGINIENSTLYSHVKQEDMTDFQYKGIKYQSSSYTKMFELNGIKIKNIDEKTCFLGNVIHASDIRKSEETAKRNLDARIYRELKDKFGWWN